MYLNILQCDILRVISLVSVFKHFIPIFVTSDTEISRWVKLIKLLIYFISSSEIYSERFKYSSLTRFTKYFVPSHISHAEISRCVKLIKLLMYFIPSSVTSDAEISRYVRFFNLCRYLSILYSSS